MRRPCLTTRVALQIILGLSTGCGLFPYQLSGAQVPTAKERTRPIAEMEASAPNYSHSRKSSSVEKKPRKVPADLETGTAVLGEEGRKPAKHNTSGAEIIGEKGRKPVGDSPTSGIIGEKGYKSADQECSKADSGACLKNSVAKPPKVLEDRRASTAGASRQAKTFVVNADDWKRLLAAHNALVAAEIRKIVDQLRLNGAGGGARESLAQLDKMRKDASSDRGRTPSGSSSDPHFRRQGDEFPNPVGGRGGELPRGNKPRSMVVGAGGFPSQGSLTGGLTTETVPIQGGGTATISTLRRDDTGATVFVAIQSRSPDGRLAGWSTTEVRSDGSTKTQTHEVSYRGPNQDVPVVTEWTEARDGSGEPTGKTQPTERPLTTGDPPVEAPVDSPAPGPSPSQPAEEGSSGAIPKQPMGIECNPITGQCRGGKAMGSTRMNPGPADGTAARASTGPRLSVDPHGLVVNPEPGDARTSAKTPRTVERDVKGPGARPPESR